MCGEVRMGLREIKQRVIRRRREAEYTGCILVDYKLRSKYKTGGLIYRRGTGMYGDGAE